MATANVTGAHPRADHPVDDRSAADRATFAAASYVRAEPLSRKGSDALARLETALPEARTLTSFSRRDVRNTVARVRGV